jgi:hypothetical protein
MGTDVNGSLFFKPWSCFTKLKGRGTFFFLFWKVSCLAKIKKIIVLFCYAQIWMYNQKNESSPTNVTFTHASNEKGSEWIKELSVQMFEFWEVVES